MRKKLMKKTIFIIPIFVLSSLFLASCNGSVNTADVTDSGFTESVTILDDTITADFTLLDSSSNPISPVGGVYSITSAGIYTASGKLNNGQIYINAPSSQVELYLSNVSIANDSVSPIFVENCTDFDLKALNGSVNYIYDNRTADYSLSDTDGRGAVYVANGDLKVKGSGTLIITSLANSGIHGKDNVTVQNVTMLIKAVNNGIRGNDKVTIKENPVIGIVCGNNGIVTHNSNLSNSGDNHGYIYIQGGSLTINSYGDGIDAAYAIEISSGTDREGNTYTPSIDIYTNKYSSYTVSSSPSLVRGGPGGHGGPGGGGFDGGGMEGGTPAEKSDTSAKALKANEHINISAGQIYTYTYDDSIHTNTNSLDTSVTYSANINISGGTLRLKASDDAIHADKTLTISGGDITVIESHEALEANIINVSGGITNVFGSDDGINASSAINVSGGYLEVSANPNGDTDGINSNGTYTQTGGVVIAKGPNSRMAAAIDTDGAASISGGTIIILGEIGERGLTKGSGISSYSLSLHASGNHTIKIDSVSYTISNQYSYGKTQCYSSVKVSADVN